VSRSQALSGTTAGTPPTALVPRTPRVIFVNSLCFNISRPLTLVVRGGVRLTALDEFESTRSTWVKAVQEPSGGVQSSSGTNFNSSGHASSSLVSRRSLHPVRLLASRATECHQVNNLINENQCRNLVDPEWYRVTEAPVEGAPQPREIGFRLLLRWWWIATQHTNQSLFQ
jgi:hypothetical protein